ncbi:beta-propeller domain-containing protein [Pseudoalteromonas xiamenensis]|uniref:beta-propeller domain-containing protein n=1 Tax=Pseudoalteromonas xiamenensis TaxID=882626 RepID=UPI0027E59033|nr:beta-propeller domain-containing protein [Pseudoalteromonas xiamenensis]WMN59623.1 beta-propeller domain-containing protein [Pseudoalteromonas xiamenensis]
MNKLALPSIICLSVVCGCSNEQTVEVKVPDLNQLQPAISSLKQADSVTFARNLKNGIYQRNVGAWNSGLYDSIRENAPISASFSQTNRQEQNVDEANRVQYNGTYLFIAANHADDLNATQSPNSYIRVLKTANNDVITPVSTMELEDDDRLNAMYLSDSSLVTLRQPMLFDIMPFAYQPIEQSVKIDNFDVSDPEQPHSSASFSIDGQLVDSRVINGNLYLVMNYFPTVESLNQDNSAVAQIENFNLIQRQTTRSLLPKITNNLTKSEDVLFNDDSCLIAENATEKDGYDGITTLIKINLSNPDERSAVCINTQVDGLYATDKSLYVYTTDWAAQQRTVFHQFSLNESQITYQASGVVAGRLSGTMANLRISEHENTLRVLTTQDNDLASFKHTLHILKPQGNELLEVGKYPNEVTDQPIGKTDERGEVIEDVYAVRFFGNKAFVVTFQRTDPLYSFDLNDPTAPKLLGTLEIPGFSSYLHPISERLLLGIGQDVDIITDDSGRELIQGKGTKVALFDIQDLQHPTQIASHTFEQAYTPVEYDYHAFTYLNANSQTTRIALPLETWVEQTSSDGMRWENHNELALFDIQDTDTPAMTFNGTSLVQYETQPEFPIGYGFDDRSVIHNDTLYYIHGNYVWQSHWLTPSENIGPR